MAFSSSRCNFPNDKMYNCVFWGLQCTRLMFQPASHTVNSLSVLFYVFWDELGPFSKFHHSCIVIAAVFCFGFLFFLMQSLFILPSAVTRARVIWSEFDLKPWMNVKEIRIGARRWDWISKKRREKPNVTLTAAYWASKLWSQLLQFNHHFKCEIEEENIN